MAKIKTLKDLRESKHMTQGEMVEKAGISRPTAWRVETLGHKASMQTIRKIAAALGVEPQEVSNVLK